MTGRILMSALLALALVACGTGTDGAPDTSPTAADGESPGASPDASPAAAEVSIDNLAYGQQEITVSAGTTVTWINNDDVGHTVTHGNNGQAVDDPMFDETIGVGEEVSITFDEPGTYQVTCTIHPQMNMVVTVEG